MRENRTKRLLRDGSVVIGGWVVSEDPTTTELMADVGFDFVVVDTEHAPQTATGLQAHMMALKDTQATGVVRVLWNDFVRVKQALDVGAEGIVFPWVNSVEQAQAAVASTRYPPRGNRGWGPRRAIRFATDQVDYFHHAEENILVLCQIETQEALDNAEAIARVDGVDALMIGPADFSIGIGVPLDWDCDKFMEGIRRVRRAADAAGKAFGVITSGAARARKWLAEGARVIIAGSDGALLQMMAKATLNEIRKALPAD